ncbi:hypothetical protein T484DRAFT_3380982 [Baffinella frigidus]|nr:hypothetical protein T484DRAFT_3380982 [Cryptophyta sp. CCMP2293]
MVDGLWFRVYGLWFRVPHSALVCLGISGVLGLSIFSLLQRAGFSVAGDPQP